MRTIGTFVSGLLLSALFLLPTSIRAAELQPFFTYKAASINSFIGVADKIAAMAGVANDNQFREIVGMIKGIKGVNLNGIFGAAAAVNDNEAISLLLIVPVTDIQQAEVPGVPGFFDQIHPFLSRRGEGRFDIATPMGSFVALQRQDHMVIVSEDALHQVPADVKSLFADLEKYTIGMKFDYEKVKFETLERNLFGPALFMMAMTNPEVGEQFENVIELYRELEKEIAQMSGGIVFNSQTADVECSVIMVTRQGSAMAQSFAGFKTQPTIFDGFRGTPDNVVFSFGDSAIAPNHQNVALMERNNKQLNIMLEGMLEQIDLEDETGEISALAEKAADSIQKMLEADQARGSVDYALSFDTSGTLLTAIDTVSLEEIKKLAAVLADFVEPRATLYADAFGIEIKESLRQEFTTVEGFKVSSFRMPVDLVELSVTGQLTGLETFTPGVFWAFKEGNKQAVALAVGLDFAKTEAAFTAALAKTATPAPVQKPVGVVSVQNLGKFMQQTIYPVAAKSGMPPEFEKTAAILASAGNDATITVDSDIKATRMETTLRISGKAIQAVVSAFKVAME